MQPKQKNIMFNIKEGENFEFMEQSMPVLRNYIQKSSLLGNEPNHEAFKKNMISLLFYLISEIYKRYYVINLEGRMSIPEKLMPPAAQLFSFTSWKTTKKDFPSLSSPIFGNSLRSTFIK
jgi:hypothetical protein